MAHPRDAIVRSMLYPGDVRVAPARRFGGRVRVPGDKSIAHRVAILAAVASGRSLVRGFAPGADCRATVACLRALGVDAASSGSTLTLIGRGLRNLSSPAGPLDAANSGTTTRLLAGILAGHPFSATITGDASLRRRPMRRVARPLELMGARVELSGGGLPMTVTGGGLRGIAYTTEVPSAQVKSAVLLAGLMAEGETSVRETAQTRDHTERALVQFGAAVKVSTRCTEIRGGQALVPLETEIPGDFSSAAFWVAAAAGVPDGMVEIEAVGLNPTRTALLDVLRRAGVEIEADDAGADGILGREPAGRVRVRHTGPVRLRVGPAEVPALIDELPALAALATFGGEIDVSGAAELRVKESDRITSLVTGLRALGAVAEERADGFAVDGRHRLAGGEADAAGDHRLAMAFAIAALGARGPSLIRGAGVVDVSYPGFFETLASLTTGHP